MAGVKFIRKNGRVIPIRDEDSQDHPVTRMIMDHVAKEHGTTRARVRQVAAARGIGTRYEWGDDEMGEVDRVLSRFNQK